MSPILIPSTTLRDAKKLFARLKHLRCKLPVLNHLLLTAGQNGIHLAATDLDHWLETRISDQPAKPACFLIPPAAIKPACRADKGTGVSFTPCGGRIGSRKKRAALRKSTSRGSGKLVFLLSKSEQPIWHHQERKNCPHAITTKRVETKVQHPDCEETDSLCHIGEDC